MFSLLESQSLSVSFNSVALLFTPFVLVVDGGEDVPGVVGVDGHVKVQPHAEPRAGAAKADKLVDQFLGLW